MAPLPEHLPIGSTMPTKKKELVTRSPARARARRQQSPGPATPRFHPGDQVRVRPGVRDPDFDDCVIGGWTGRILSTGEGEDGEHLCRVKWDRETLAKIPRAVKAQADVDDLDVSRMDLLPRSLERIAAPATSVDAGLSEHNQDDRIRAALGLRSSEDHPDVSEDTLLTYFMYLRKHLTFPFEAVHRDESGDWGDRATRVTVMGLLDPDESPEFDSGYGIVCVIKAKGRGSGEVPLADIEVKKSLTQHRLVYDYAIWFANNR